MGRVLRLDDASYPEWTNFLRQSCGKRGINQCYGGVRVNYFSTATSSKGSGATMRWLAGNFRILRRT
jgi:hypothetical protein